jgi:hypothetical protein
MQPLPPRSEYREHLLLLRREVRRQFVCAAVIAAVVSMALVAVMGTDRGRALTAEMWAGVGWAWAWAWARPGRNRIKVYEQILEYAERIHNSLLGHVQYHMGRDGL